MKFENWITQYPTSNSANDPFPLSADERSSLFTLHGRYCLVSLTYRYHFSAEASDSRNKSRERT